MVPIYLDHASTSWPKAPGVAAAMQAALELPGSAGRGAGVGAVAAGAIADELRRELAGIINAEDPRRVVLSTGATEALNVAILGVVRSAADRGRSGGLAPRPRVVTTQVEHNAVRRPLLALADRGEIELAVVPAGPDTLIDPARVIEAADGAALVAMTWASNVSGAIQPVGPIAEALAGTQTLLLVDASQTAGLVRSAEPLGSTGVDLLAFSGHKALAGPPGVGALYIGPKAHPLRRGADTDAGRARVEPVLSGGTGSDSARWEMPADLPGRFEAGTPNTPAHAGLLAAIRGHPGPDAALRHVRSLVEHLHERLGSMPRGVRALGPGRGVPGVGVLAIAVDGYSSEEVAAVLESEFGVLVRGGLHCAPTAHEALGTLAAGGAVRVSVGGTSTTAEIDALVDALGRMAGCS